MSEVLTEFPELPDTSKPRSGFPWIITVAVLIAAIMTLGILYVSVLSNNAKFVVASKKQRDQIAAQQEDLKQKQLDLTTVQQELTNTKERLDSASTAANTCRSVAAALSSVVSDLASAGQLTTDAMSYMVADDYTDANSSLDQASEKIKSANSTMDSIEDDVNSCAISGGVHA
jgi:ABC-type transport system involved in cytochrome bd biosynthesis fused ATPase/permease subunit